MTNIVDINKNKKNQEEYSVVDRFQHIASFIDNELEYTHPNLAKIRDDWKHDFQIIQKTPTHPIKIYSVQNNTATLVTKEYMASQIMTFFKYHGNGPLKAYVWDLTKTLKCVDFWIQTTAHSRSQGYKAIVFKSEKEIGLHRLTFDPDLSVTLDNLEAKAPVCSEFLFRMGNFDAFMARVGSIFDFDCDRKQAVYINGLKDSGKSQIMWLISYISGASAQNGGSYATLSNEDLNTNFWRACLVDKRVLCIGEASHHFLNRSSFKSITGDDTHNINQKGVPMYVERLNPILFFFSNDEPAIHSKPDLIERVIHCPISPPPIKTKHLLTPAQYQKKLKAELPAFIGACINQYKKYDSGRIPCSRASLMEAIEQGESFATDFFDQHFIEGTSSDYVYAKDVVNVFNEAGIKSGKIQNVYLQIWTRAFGIKKVRAREGEARVWVYKGLRAKYSLASSDNNYFQSLIKPTK